MNTILLLASVLANWIQFSSTYINHVLKDTFFLKSNTTYPSGRDRTLLMKFEQPDRL
jgi:hypothetical protein